MYPAQEGKLKAVRPVSKGLAASPIPGARQGSKVNVCETLIKVVTREEPKILIGSSQMVRSWL
jgi:hypothetical protein